MKKWLIYLLSAVLILVYFFIIILPVVDSLSGHIARKEAERQVEQIQVSMEALWDTRGDELTFIADSVLLLHEQYQYPTSFHLYPGGEKSIRPTKILSKPTVLYNQLYNAITQFSQNSEIEFAQIFYANKNPFYYPQDSCVFRYSIKVDDDEYCHCDLIYSPNWEQHKQDGNICDPFGNDLSKRVADDWYVVVLYPYEYY